MALVVLVDPPPKEPLPAGAIPARTTFILSVFADKFRHEEQGIEMNESKPNSETNEASVQSVVMRMVVKLTVDSSFAECKDSEDESERRWFYDDILGDPNLFLHSNLIGDYIGTIKVVRIEST